MQAAAIDQREMRLNGVRVLERSPDILSLGMIDATVAGEYAANVAVDFGFVRHEV